MKDIMVSIRLPEQLLLRVKKKVKEGTFMDTSEAVRSIIRDAWMQYSAPELKQLSQLKEEISSNLRERKEKMITKEVIEELERIKKLVMEGKIDE